MLDILIVEDNLEIGTLLRDFLQREQYVISVAQLVNGPGLSKDSPPYNKSNQSHQFQVYQKYNQEQEPFLQTHSHKNTHHLQAPRIE